MLTQKHCLDFEKVLATILAKDFLGFKLKKTSAAKGSGRISFCVEPRLALR
jgi:hypothetical protein